LEGPELPVSKPSSRDPTTPMCVTILTRISYRVSAADCESRRPAVLVAHRAPRWGATHPRERGVAPVTGVGEGGDGENICHGTYSSRPPTRRFAYRCQEKQSYQPFPESRVGSSRLCGVCPWRWQWDPGSGFEGRFAGTSPTGRRLPPIQWTARRVRARLGTRKGFRTPC
jgi:hypothetical protein